MSRKRNGKSDKEKELIDTLFTRQITNNDDLVDYWDKEHIKALRQYHWHKLANWDGAKNCLSALQTIMSCALSPQFLLYNEAHDWIVKNIKQKGVESFITAVCILIANYFPNRRPQILNQIVDRYMISFSKKAYTLWQSTREKTSLSWNQIQSTIVPNFEWIAWPIIRKETGELSEESEELFWACY